VLGLLNYDADNPKDGGFFINTDRLDIGVLKNRYGRVGRWASMRFAGAASHLEPIKESR
jgi:hypothetical protein